MYVILGNDVSYYIEEAFVFVKRKEKKKKVARPDPDPDPDPDPERAGQVGSGQTCCMYRSDRVGFGPELNVY